jgi:hypothetical protein
MENDLPDAVMFFKNIGFRDELVVGFPKITPSYTVLPQFNGNFPIISENT